MKQIELEMWAECLDETLLSLSTRAKNCLVYMSLKTVHEVRLAVCLGVLNPSHACCRNYGLKTHEEVCHKLGITPLENCGMYRLKGCGCCAYRTDLKIRSFFD